MRDRNKISIKKHFPIWVILIAAVLTAFVVIVSVKTLSAGSIEKKVSRQLTLAEKYISELDYDQAILIYDSILKIDPRNTDAYLGLAEVYEITGEYELAGEILERALKSIEDETEVLRIVTEQKKVNDSRNEEAAANEIPEEIKIADEDEKTVRSVSETTPTLSAIPTETVLPTLQPALTEIVTPTLQPTATTEADGNDATVATITPPVITEEVKPTASPVATEPPREVQSKGVKISADSFPDSVFRDLVLEWDMDGDGYLSEDEAATPEEWDISDSEISSLEGIDYFTALTTLDCSENKLTNLTIKGCTNLTELFCNDNMLSSLKINSCRNLLCLDCSSNLLKKLDLRGCNKITELFCDSNNLSEINTDGCEMLEYFSCMNNQLRQLDVSGCGKLDVLYCNNNSLTGLDLSGNKALTQIGCSGNNITALDVSACRKLESLDIDDETDIIG